MKTLRIILLACATFMIITACDDCKQDLCEDITCLNGGQCINGECDCPEGFTGPDCSKEITPNSINVRTISVTKLPTAPGYPFMDWDFGVKPGSYPDLYAQLRRTRFLDPYGIGKTSMVENAAMTDDGIILPLPSTISFNLPLVEYQVELYDEDGSTDEVIGIIEFTPYNVGNKFPETLYLDNGNGLMLELGVSYNF